MIANLVYEELKNKRMAGIDYGMKRIGLAYTDEMHISINPKATIENNAEKWDKIASFFKEERIAAIIVGMPYTKDNTETDWIKNIKLFITDLQDRYKLPVYTQDEYGTSDKAVTYMINSGVKKKKRAEKGSKDKIAACVILAEFLAGER